MVKVRSLSLPHSLLGHLIHPCQQTLRGTSSLHEQGNERAERKLSLCKTGHIERGRNGILVNQLERRSHHEESTLREEEIVPCTVFLFQLETLRCSLNSREGCPVFPAEVTHKGKCTAMEEREWCAAGAVLLEYDLMLCAESDMRQRQGSQKPSIFCEAGRAEMERKYTLKVPGMGSRSPIETSKFSVIGCGKECLCGNC